MVARIETGLDGVTVHAVSDLYTEFARMDVPAFYQDGGANPFAGRCGIIPRKASHYAMVPERDERGVALARALIKGISRRRKVHEVVCEKHEINFNQFSKASRIVILYA